MFRPSTHHGGRLPTFWIALVLAVGIGLLVTAPVAAARPTSQSGIAQVVVGIDDIAVPSGEVLLVIGAMAVLAVMEMVAFEYFAHSSGDGRSTTREESLDDERPRAVVTFDPDTETHSGENPADGDHDGRLSVRTMVSSLFGDSNPPAVEKGDDRRTATESTDADTSTLVNAVTRIEDSEAGETEPEPLDGSGQSVVKRVQARATAAIHELCGRVRMLVNRRVVDLRAYGVVENWDTLTISTDADPVVTQHLVEIVDLGELEVEIVRPNDDGQPAAGSIAPDGGRPAPSTKHVWIPRENIAQLEATAARDRPEAKRSVTLLRRVLRSNSSGTVVRRFVSEESGDGPAPIVVR